MKLDNSFEIALPPGDAWRVLLDIERIAPCMPGTELIEMVDENTYRGNVSVRLGPVALSFDGTARFEEVDELNRQARVSAQGDDSKGRGGASATVVFSLEPTAAGSRVVVDTDLDLTGSIAQYGRGVGMIKSVAGQLIDQFSKNLEAELARTATNGEQRKNPALQQPTAETKPISLFALLWETLRQRFARLVKSG